MLRHYDNLNWTIVSILIGSNIVALGMVSNLSSYQAIFAASFGGSLSLSAWMLWFLRHASIYNVKNDRLYMIEHHIGMAQHRMVGYARRKVWLTKISGLKTAFILYFSLTLAWLLTLI